MAAYISVPRDLTRVKAKVFMNLTKRQVICFGTAVLIGVPSFFLLKEYAGNTAATLGMMILMLPTSSAVSVSRFSRTALMTCGLNTARCCGSSWPRATTA